MIARLALPVIIVLLLDALFFDRTSWRHQQSWRRLLCWLLPIGAIVVTVIMANTPYYFPDQMYKLELYLAMLVFLVLPMTLVPLCSLLGRWAGRPLTGRLTGWLLSLAGAASWVYGCTVGFSRFEVVQVQFSSPDLPDAFDGYRIVQFSDAHVGTYSGFRHHLLQRAVDSINAQHADMVVFTGDLQNKQPSEVEEHQALLSTIKAPDGVISVMGNHDYAHYLGTVDPYVMSSNMEQLIRLQQHMGWTPLLNDHVEVWRDSSRIIIAGMENDGEGRFPQRGDVTRTLSGLSTHEFVVMLEHDPTSWRRKILPQCHAQLTLSGHTHGGQLALLGWSPASFAYREYCGMYRSGPRTLYVSKGLGAAIPFRLGATGEIVVITLHKNDYSPQLSGRDTSRPY